MVESFKFEDKYYVLNQRKIIIIAFEKNCYFFNNFTYKVIWVFSDKIVNTLYYIRYGIKFSVDDWMDDINWYV